MNIPKAIELNIESEKSLRDHEFIDHADAIKLGNEALKRIIEKHEDDELLPGETEKEETEK